MFKALLLDVDGTLVDTYAAENCAINATLAQVDWLGGIDTTEFALEWRMQRKRHPTSWLDGSADLEKMRAVRLSKACRHFGRNPSAAEIRQLTELLHSKVVNACRPFPDSRAVLGLLGRLPVGIITNGYERVQKAKLAAAGFDGSQFSPFLASAEQGIAKPRPELFLRACTALQLPPSDCMYVGDDVHDDQQAASTAGLIGVLLDRGGKSGLSTGSCVVRTLEQVAQKLHLP